VLPAPDARDPFGPSGVGRASPEGPDSVYRTIRLTLLATLVAFPAACGSDPVEPEPVPDPVIYERQGFRIEDLTGEAPPELVDSIGARLAVAVAAVAALLPEFPVPDDTMTFTLQPGAGIPYVTPSENRIVQWDEDLALEYLYHQVTHLLTGYQRSAFLEEGIAIYAGEMLDPDSRITNPYRGQPPHAWVSLYEQNGSTISLFTAFRATNFDYAYAGSSPDASAWQVFVEAASFTRWVFDALGRDAWLRLYDIGDLGIALNADTPELERAWLTEARDAYPTPLSCEEALGTRGPLTSRDEFWCARTRGE